MKIRVDSNLFQAIGSLFFSLMETAEWRKIKAHCREEQVGDFLHEIKWIRKYRGEDEVTLN